MRLPIRAVVLAAAAATLAAPRRTFVSPRDSQLGADDVLSLPYNSTSIDHPPRHLLLRRDDAPPAPTLSMATTATTGTATTVATAAATATKGAAATGSAAASAVRLRPNDSFNVTAWDLETNAACVAALRAILRSTNPSGTCVCYNLPSLDSVTGIFEADLRLFRVSEARDAFADVRQSHIQVGVQFNGASVSSISEEELMGMGMVRNRTVVIEPRAHDGGPQLVHTYMFVGQIDEQRMSANMSMAAFEAVVMPTFTLSATTRSGGDISTNVSLNEAAFLTGVFANQVIMSDVSAAQAAVDAKLAGLRNGTVAFVLPGVQLMVFPIGLIITSVWLLLGLVAFTIGTFERIVYADMYKRRLQSVAPKGRTI
ncbi:hypothetical protein DCS_02962 [Drechmeria coniospora]|uniref:Uncharacterized protein n=1 Tax=Drechmeria coniospora TaxID=98403 RepID=A0A151GXJ1_DRECN|nr:hypothetical protein DCS_02962 [Drechmeria coniospora]KYK61818.1 hypothetical protein DCS_02962 [Drechmeria coniospora]ODA82628.1 hypothetical protein RJ55_01136 [Drechmeria coniospora]